MNHIIRVSEIEYEGRKRLDMRLWVYDNEKADYVPTKRGIAVRPDQLVDFKQEFDRVSASMLQAV
jgi:hypothetical protein